VAVVTLPVRALTSRGALGVTVAELWVDEKGGSVTL